MKYYFETEDSEICYTKEHFVEVMKEESLTEIEVIEAKRTKDNEYFWCTYFGEVGEKGYCGKACKEYTPRNGKSGNCKHNGSLYEKGEKTILKL